MNRLLSFSLIASFGFLLLVSLLVNSVMDVMSDRLKLLFADATVYIFYVINTVVIFFTISLLFAIIFKVLPDAKIRWRDAFVGAFFTALLFLIGKFLISFYLGSSSNWGDLWHGGLHHSCFALGVLFVYHLILWSGIYKSVYNALWRKDNPH